MKILDKKALKLKGTKKKMSVSYKEVGSENIQDINEEDKTKSSSTFLIKDFYHGSSKESNSTELSSVCINCKQDTCRHLQPINSTKEISLRTRIAAIGSYWHEWKRGATGYVIQLLPEEDRIVVKWDNPEVIRRVTDHCVKPEENESHPIVQFHCRPCGADRHLPLRKY